MAESTKKKPGVIIWILFALLIFSLGGFGVSSFGGSVRSIGAVGSTQISVNEYSLSLQNLLRRFQFQGLSAPSLATPHGQELARSVRGQLLANAALKEETERLGLSVGDDAVRERLLENPAFHGLTGGFDREVYADSIRRAGFQETEYEDSLRAESASQLTAAAAAAGFEAHETMVGIMANYMGERRDMLWLKLDASALEAPVPAPTDEEIQAAYEADPEAYTAPEMKDITYVSLTPEMMLSEIEVPEEELRRLYDERSSEYNRPERRLVERLVFPDQAAAEAAKAALEDGATFESLVQGRGLTLPDVDLGDVTQDELGEAGADVFALEGPDVVGPVETPLGPALFRMNAVLAAEVTSFEDVRDALTDEAERDRAVRAIEAMREDIDDILASGATLEEVASETDMDLGTLRFSPESSEDIAAYAAFREAAQAVTVDDYPELVVLEDGGLAALQLDEVVPPALRPLEDVREDVIANWTRDETKKRLGDLGEMIRAQRLAGETLETQGYTPETHLDMARDSFLDGAPEGMIDTLFALKADGIEVFSGEDALHIVELTGITPPTGDDEDAEQMRDAITATIVKGASEDALSLFVAAIEAQSGISLDQAAINAVHANFP